MHSPSRRLRRVAMLGSAMAIIVPLVLVAGPDAGATPRHGVSPFKVCNPTVQIGQPYTCSYAIQDTDGFHDTMTLSDIDDVITASGGEIDSGNILGSLDLIFDPGVVNPSAMPSCTGGSGAGTIASPYVNATLCTIPWDSQIETENYSFYNAVPLDYNLNSEHQLTDTVTFTWDSLCESGISCPPPNQIATIGGSSVVEQLPSQTTTTVRDSSGTNVTAVSVGTTVHDFVTVAPASGAPPKSPTPTGSVTIDWFTNGTCTAPANAVSSPLTLNSSGQVNATGFNFTPTSAGQYAFQAHYTTDPTNPAYTASDGPCEPLTVVDANITISPLTATNPVGATHTFTVTVTENPGTGSVAPPDGTKPTLALVNSGGATATLTGGTCGTTGTVAGICTFTIVSPTTGVTTATASVTLTVDGVSVTRSTDGPDSSGDSGPATKTWVKAGSSTVTVVQLGGVTVTSVPLGSTVTDQATVSGTGAGTPTGTVSFLFFTNSSCTGTGTAEGSPTLVSGVATSNPVGPLMSAGTDSFQATYSGDSNYTGSTGDCEPFTVGKAPSTTVTVVQLGGVTVTAPIPLGSTVTDQATVSGTGAGTPTGTVSFTFFTNDTCAGTGTAEGSPTLASGVATSNMVGPLAAGMDSFQATYNGDSNYKPSTGTVNRSR